MYGCVKDKRRAKVSLSLETRLTQGKMGNYTHEFEMFDHKAPNINISIYIGSPPYRTCLVLQVFCTVFTRKTATVGIDEPNPQ